MLGCLFDIYLSLAMGINGLKIIFFIKNIITKQGGKCFSIFLINLISFKLKLNKLEKRRLQESLNNQCVVSDAQLEEINKLRYRVNHEEIIQSNLLVI